MLTGRIDEIRGDTIFGWAADPEAPAEKAKVEVLLDGKSVATALADRPRPDLAAGGLGDGSHAFVVRIPEPPGSAKLRVIARSAAGSSVDLEVADPAERHLERLFDVHAARWEANHAALAAEVGRLREALLDLRSAGIDRAAVDALEQRTADVEAKLDETDVFLMRMDGSLRALQDRVGAPRRGLLARIFRGGKR